MEPADLENDVVGYDNVMSTREVGYATAERFEEMLDIYLEHHPALAGPISSMRALLPGLHRGAGEIAVLVSSLEYLTKDEELTLADHAALQSLMESILDQTDVVLLLLAALRMIKGIYVNHDPFVLGVTEESD